MSYTKINPYLSTTRIVFEMQNENTAISKSPYQITGTVTKINDVVTLQLDKFSFICDTSSNCLKSTTLLPDEFKYKPNADLCYPIANVQEKMIYLVLNSSNGNEITLQAKGMPFVCSDYHEIKGISVSYIGTI